MSQSLEALVLDLSPGDTPDLSGFIMQSDFGEEAPAGPAAEAELDTAPPLDLISAEAFQEQWNGIHDMMGGMVQMRTGAPCPLGNQARSEGGLVACRAAYGLLSASPALARLFLSPNSTFWGQFMAIGLHGFACVQVVKASRAEGAAAQSIDMSGRFDREERMGA